MNGAIGVDNLDRILGGLKDEGKVIVLCHGVFDLLHPGHIDHFTEAKSIGDILVVSVTDDAFVDKGPGRPLLSLHQRVRMVSALSSVDFVVVSQSESAVDTISRLRPHYYVKGSDYLEPDADLAGNLIMEKEAVEQYGGALHFTQGPLMSSSSLINQLGLQDNQPAHMWLQDFRRQYSANHVADVLKSIESLNVLVVGEAIIDEYVFCEALGKSSKDPILAFKRLNTETYLGGSLAIAKHCHGLGASVTVAYRRGTSFEDSELIANKLPTGVDQIVDSSDSYTTIRKSRYVDKASETRLFETYSINESEGSSELVSPWVARVGGRLDRYDLILIADYGHGLIGSDLINLLSQSGAKLAVNTQTNAGNRGVNSISRYPRVDFLCLNGSEVGRELRSRKLTMDVLVPKLREKTNADLAIVTEGLSGVIASDRDGSSSRIPAFSTNVRDRVGAGDALFAISSLLYASKAPLPMIGLLGNVAGAMAIGYWGNKRTLDSQSVRRHATNLLK